MQDAPRINHESEAEDTPASQASQTNITVAASHPASKILPTNARATDMQATTHRPHQLVDKIVYSKVKGSTPAYVESAEQSPRIVESSYRESIGQSSLPHQASQFPQSEVAAGESHIVQSDTVFALRFP